MKDWYKSTCLKLPRHSESSSQSPSPVNAKRVDSSSVGGSFSQPSKHGLSKVQQESPPSQCSPQGCSGLWQQSSVESKPNLEETFICITYICLGNPISVSLSCSSSLNGVPPSAVILATLQVALTVNIAITVSFSCAAIQLWMLHTLLVLSEKMVWTDLLCKHCFCHNSYPHRRRDPWEEWTSQVRSLIIPAAIISWVEAGTLTVVFSTHLN